jgi:hypothetical protein
VPRRVGGLGDPLGVRIDRVRGVRDGADGLGLIGVLIGDQRLGVRSVGQAGDLPRPRDVVLDRGDRGDPVTTVVVDLSGGAAAVQDRGQVPCGVVGELEELPSRLGDLRQPPRTVVPVDDLAAARPAVGLGQLRDRPGSVVGDGDLPATGLALGQERDLGPAVVGVVAVVGGVALRSWVLSR